MVIQIELKKIAVVLFSQLLCIIVEEEGDIAAFKDFVPTAADDILPSTGPPKADAAAPTPPPAPVTPAPPVQAPPPPRPATPPVQAPPAPAPSAAPSGGPILATPYARTLAAEKGVDLSVSIILYPLPSSSRPGVCHYNPHP